MKRFLAILILSLLSFGAMAQAPTMDDLIAKYSKQKGCTTISLTETMLKSMDIGAGIQHMQAISIESIELIDDIGNDVAEITSHLELMLSVNNGTNRVKIYSLTNENAHITEMVIFTESDGKSVVVCFKGDNIEFNAASSIAITN